MTWAECIYSLLAIIIYKSRLNTAVRAIKHLMRVGLGRGGWLLERGPRRLLPQQIKDIELITGVEVRQGFVGEYPFRFTRQHTRQQDTRPLAAG